VSEKSNTAAIVHTRTQAKAAFGELRTFGFNMNQLAEQLAIQSGLSSELQRGGMVGWPVHSEEKYRVLAGRVLGSPVIP